MSIQKRTRSKAGAGKVAPAAMARDRGQVVLVLQGGGALGAFQVGAYQALHEAGIEPDWIIGTSIGAINAALIAGNPPTQRLAALEQFWSRITQPARPPWLLPAVAAALNDFGIMTRGVPGFFEPGTAAWLGMHAGIGIERAAFYDTAPLAATLGELLDVGRLNAGAPRLTVGAVNVESGAMRYFDSRRETLGIEHVLASGALPPAFPAVCIEGEAYWDGGIYSNTPIEAVLDDDPRQSSLIFAVNVWHAHGAMPNSIAEVLERQKDIQYASRAHSHIARQQQLHQLRHVIRQLTAQLPAAAQKSAAVRELASFGCGTTMQVVMLTPPHLATETHTKDIDFSAEGIASRRELGYTQTQAALARAPWRAPVDASVGVVVHADPDN